MHSVRPRFGATTGADGRFRFTFSASEMTHTLLTSDEYRAMADGLADTDGPATGKIAVTEWITENKDTLGRRYANEISRHFR